MTKKELVDYLITYTVADQGSVKIPNNAIPIGMKEGEKITRDEFGRSIVEKEFIVIYLEPQKGR